MRVDEQRKEIRLALDAGCKSLSVAIHTCLHIVLDVEISIARDRN